MRQQRVGFFMTLMLLLAVGVGLLRGQPDLPDAALSTRTVGTPVAQPSTLVVNQTTLVTVTSQITTTARNPVIPGSVKLQRVDAKGKVIATLDMEQERHEQEPQRGDAKGKVVATLGTMVDDGTQGDAVAGG